MCNKVRIVSNNEFGVRDAETSASIRYIAIGS
jgi:hypothetical protein